MASLSTFMPHVTLVSQNYELSLQPKEIFMQNFKCNLQRKYRSLVSLPRTLLCENEQRFRISVRKVKTQFRATDKNLQLKTFLKLES